MTYDELEAKAGAGMDPVLRDYVAGGAGDEHRSTTSATRSSAAGSGLNGYRSVSDLAPEMLVRLP